jgi:hypothetical protein
MFFVMGTERLLPAKLGFITEMLPKSKVKMHFQLPELSLPHSFYIAYFYCLKKTKTPWGMSQQYRLIWSLLLKSGWQSKRD